MNYLNNEAYMDQTAFKVMDSIVYSLWFTVKALPKACVTGFKWNIYYTVFQALYGAAYVLWT